MKRVERALILLVVRSVLFASSWRQNNKGQSKLFTDTFMQDSCAFLARGRNAFFVLEPGYQLILEGMEGREKRRLVVTVLNETRKIGGIETRIVEEKESVNDETIEI